MFELVMKDVAYPLNFGMGFVRKIDKRINIPVDGLPGVKKDIGLNYAIMSILNNDVVVLANVIDLANEGQTPRLTPRAIDEFLEDESTNIDEVFEKVIGFFKSANCTHKAAIQVLNALEQSEEETARAES